MACGIGREVFIIRAGKTVLVFREYQSLSDIMDLLVEQSIEGPVTIERGFDTTFKSA